MHKSPRELHRIEILASLTGKVKWDGVAICLKNGRVTPVLVEFSGGIQFNATENKQTVDESKMMKSMITMIEYSEHMLNIEPPIPQYFVRSFGKCGVGVTSSSRF